MIQPSLLPESISEKTVRDRLIRMLDTHKHLIMFNIQGVGHYQHEMDLCRLLPSGYVQEFEIKTNREDIKREVKKIAKYTDFWNGAEVKIGVQGHIYPRCNKLSEGKVGDEYLKVVGYYEGIYARYQHCVREFYVAVPEEANLVGSVVELLPEWVGIIEVSGKHYCPSWKSSLKRSATKSPVTRKITS